MVNVLLKNNWEVLAEDFNSPFIRNFIWVSAFPMYQKLFGLPQVTLGTKSRHGKLKYMGDGQTWGVCHNELKKRAEKDQSYVGKIIDETNNLAKEFNSWSEKEIQNKDLSILDGAQILELYNLFIQKQAILYAYGVILPIMDFKEYSFVEGNLKKILEKYTKGNNDQFQTLFVLFTNPSQKSFAKLEEIDRLNLMSQENISSELKELIIKKDLKSIQENFSVFYHQLEEHRKKHSWVYYVYQGPAFGFGDFLELMKISIENNVDLELALENIKSKEQKIKQDQDEFFRNYNLDNFEKMILKLAGKFVWAKPYRKDLQSKSYFHLEKLLREFMMRFHITLKQARNVPVSVLELALETGEIDTKLINSIEKHHVCIPDPEDKSKVIILTGEDAKDFDAKLQKENEDVAVDIKELKGTCACEGKVTGTARIINQPSDMSKMQIGDILVSIATTPSIVAAMQKAAGIVTDEGGLTCHAAIVAREMNTPCVIGTKVATRVIKDGDLVEVDAGNGIVRILQRA